MKADAPDLDVLLLLINTETMSKISWIALSWWKKKTNKIKEEYGTGTYGGGVALCFRRSCYLRHNESEKKWRKFQLIFVKKRQMKKDYRISNSSFLVSDFHEGNLTTILFFQVVVFFVRV